jgi:large subunit ribosomal protein L18Ae
MKLYQVVGRKAPIVSDVDVEANPPAYRMKIFAPNQVMARSKFWYFMHQMRKMKKTSGEILDINEITEKNSRYIKNFGIWLKYSSRSGTHNMYREYRDTTLTGAIDTMYMDMAGRHRTRSRSIQIIKTGTVLDKDCKKVGTTQYHTTGEGKGALKFPLPHRIQRAATKDVKSVFLANRPSTHFR